MSKLRERAKVKGAENRKGNRRQIRFLLPSVATFSSHSRDNIGVAGVVKCALSGSKWENYPAFGISDCSSSKMFHFHAFIHYHLLYNISRYNGAEHQIHFLINLSVKLISSDTKQSRGHAHILGRCLISDGKRQKFTFSFAVSSAKQLFSLSIICIPWLPQSDCRFFLFFLLQNPRLTAEQSCTETV